MIIGLDFRKYGGYVDLKILVIDIILSIIYKNGPCRPDTSILYFSKTIYLTF